MFDKLEAVVKRYETLTERLADPTIYERQEEFKKTSEERAGIEELVNTFKEYQKIKTELQDAKDLLMNESDADLLVMVKEDISRLDPEIPIMEEKLKLLLLPKDPLDEKNVILEIRAGAGGDEASIFVADVWRMYKNYFNKMGFRSDVVSLSEGDRGIKEIIVNVSGDKVYSKMKYESGVHRVQRVPETEAQGRVHTSTITVAVMPEADEVEFKLNLNDVRIDVYRSSGAGGQSVNTTDSAVRLTHIPTGFVIAMQDERSQLKNKEKAFKIMKAKLFDLKVQEAQQKEAATRKGLVGTGDRSERIRTYNFPQGRVSDHRINLTIYNLPAVIEGDIGEIIDALIAHNQAVLLKGEDE